MCTVDIKAQKQDLRRQYKAIRLGILKAEKEKLDASVFKNVQKLASYQEAQIIFAYASSSIEVDTFAILEHALSHGKTVALPRCIPGTRQMDFYKIESLQDLEKGSYGILEPRAIPKNKIENFNWGLCIVPALCYDREGYRLGYGGGYYDRFLPKFSGHTVGLTYASCFQEALPKDTNDFAVEAVITEQGTFLIQKNRQKGGAF